MKSKPPVDVYSKRIAGVSSVVASGFGSFWLIHLVRGWAEHDVFLLVNVFFFAALAYVFAQIARAGGGSVGIMPMLIFLASALRFVRNPLATQSLGAAGVVTFLAAVGLFVADLGLRHRKRRAAQPGVEPDGPSARGLTP